MKHRHRIPALFLALLPWLGTQGIASEFEVIEMGEGFGVVADPDGWLRLKVPLFNEVGTMSGKVDSISKGQARIKLAPNAELVLGSFLTDTKENSKSALACPEVRMSRPGWEGLSMAFLFGGRTSLSTTSVKVSGSSNPTENTSSQGDWSGALLYRAAGNLWLGPTFSYGLSSESSRQGSSFSKTSSTVYAPGVAFRTPIASGKDQYIALGSFLSYRIFSAEQEDLVSGTTTTVNVSGTGIGYGGGVSFGQRLGAQRSYLLEAGVDVGMGTINYSATGGGANSTGSIGGTTFSFNIAIGMAL